MRVPSSSSFLHTAGKVHDHPLKTGKIPYPLRIRGSVVSRIWFQVLIIAIFSTAITCLSELVDGFDLGIPATVVTTLSFVVGLALSFRTTTAYANWKEGRQAWEKLSTVSRNLTRLIWVHGPENGTTRDRLLKKSAINLIVAFAVSLKHHLREERGHEAEDVRALVAHLDTYSAIRGILRSDSDQGHAKESSNQTHSVYELDVGDTTANYCASYGSLPLEISHALASYLDFLRLQRGMDIQTFGQGLAQQSIMMDLMSTTERILLTPIPVAYNIVISQLVWLFMLFLPFQLQTTLHWVSIPATIVTALMLFGLAEIGLEIENPWGDDVNDLDIDRYAHHIAVELDTLTTLPPPQVHVWAEKDTNMPLFPYSSKTFKQLESLPMAELQDMLKLKAHSTKEKATDPLRRKHRFSKIWHLSRPSSYNTFPENSTVSAQTFSGKRSNSGKNVQRDASNVGSIV